ERRVEEDSFDDLTQDEDEEEVMSSASEESVLSVPELQETMKQLTWLAAERRLCADGDSEEDNSPTSPGWPKEEESGEGRSRKPGRDEETPSGNGTPRGGGRCPGRGRGVSAAVKPPPWGRSRPLRGLRRSRSERHSKDAAKLLQLYDENLLNNDPHRESKDVAFAQSYLSRVREALHDLPGQVEEFVCLLNGFEQVGDGHELTSLFRKLRCVLGERTDLLRDFAAFLHPQQALQCGLFEEQQAFERSRRFLRQLEISFGDNPSHYQKIIKALQTGPDLSPSSIDELKVQMAALLKGHTHLQAEFWVFFDELRPPPARPGQFEEAHWPDEGGVAGGGFEEVTLPELEDEEEGHKIQPMTGRRRRRKIAPHRNYKVCSHTWRGTFSGLLLMDSSTQSLSSVMRDRQVRLTVHIPSGLRGRVQSHEESGPSVSSDRLHPRRPRTNQRPGSEGGQQPSSARCVFYILQPNKTRDRKHTSKDRKPRTTNNNHSVQSVKTNLLVFLLLTDGSNCSFCPQNKALHHGKVRSLSLTRSWMTNLPVCAKNISLSASGEKVILWTREADRVILTTCQREGANQETFQSVSTLLSNKTPSEVSRRFRDLMRLFRTAARQTGSEDEAPPTQPGTANEKED
uniref:Myb-like domain-containing protein n=1 Tax=Gasterosteus aculeatus TaxID=69293 RepID=G3NFE6_GASAC